MIFVTVGTHEQPFNRLVSYMDHWAEEHDEEVIIQTGYSTYEPTKAVWGKLYPYKEMLSNVEKARIVITHGGPSSFIMPLQIGKIPIVVPRQFQYGEHVNDHQVDFCRKIIEKQGNIIVVEDINELEKIIKNYESMAMNLNYRMKSNNDRFCSCFASIVNDLIKE